MLTPSLARLTPRASMMSCTRLGLRRCAWEPAHLVSRRGVHSSLRTATRPAWRSARVWAAGLAGAATILGYSYVQLRWLGQHDQGEKATETVATPPEPEPASDEPGSVPTVLWGAVVRYVVDPFLILKRFAVLVCLFLPVILTSPLLFLGRASVSEDSDGHREERPGWGANLWYRILVHQMELAGPTFVKLGQWAGSRRDLFPDTLCNYLAKLHSSNRPHKMAHTRKMLEQSFGRPFDEIFVSFDENTVGVGAVGQVYKAVLRKSLLPQDYLTEKKKQASLSRATENIGRELALTYEEDDDYRHAPGSAVAIKVLHPKVRSTIGLDIKIMTFFARCINVIPGMQWVSLPEEVDRFAALMFSQLDLRTETENLLRFERNFAGRGGVVTFPRPLKAFCSKDVLVEELIEAVPLKHFMELGGLDFDTAIAEMGLDAFLKMLLIDNFTHADLHPGNIMVKFYRPTTRSMLQNVFSRIFSRFDPDYVLGHRSRTGIIPDGEVVAELLARKHDKRAWREAMQSLENAGYLPELVMLDAGLVSELTPVNLRNFLDLFAAIATFDGRRAGTLMVERCRSPEMVTDKEAFVGTIDRVVQDVTTESFSLRTLNIGDVLSQVLVAVRKYHVKMEPDFVDTVLSILILEGIGRRLYPDLDLFQSAVPILRSLGHKMSKDESQMAHLRDQMTFSNFLPMLKLWFFMEARSFLKMGPSSPQVVDAFVRYGWMSD